MMKSDMKLKKGFTLIELLVVIGIIGILAAIVLIAVNPGRQFAQARDTQRLSDLRAITDAIYQFAAEHNGDLPDTDGNDTTSNFPQALTEIGTAGFNLAIAGNAADPTITVVPTYIAAMPTDPSTGDQAGTGYFLFQNANGRLVASATGELTPSISVER